MPFLPKEYQINQLEAKLLAIEDENKDDDREYLEQRVDELQRIYAEHQEVRSRRQTLLFLLLFIDFLSGKSAAAKTSDDVRRRDASADRRHIGGEQTVGIDSGQTSRSGAAFRRRPQAIGCRQTEIATEAGGRKRSQIEGAPFRQSDRETRGSHLQSAEISPGFGNGERFLCLFFYN